MLGIVGRVSPTDDVPDRRVYTWFYSTHSDSTWYAPVSGSVSVPVPAVL